MKKEEKDYLKEHAPWDYDSLYGDPVTGRTGIDTTGVEVFFIVLIALGIWGLKCLIC
jgi:hypothetical protein